MHSDLIAKLEALDGPSRDLDGEIATDIGGYVYEKRGRDQKAWFYPADGGWRRQLNSIFADKLPAYTASLDAAIALVERMLPGWLIASLGQDDGKKWHAELRQGHRTSYSTVALAGAPTPAIALLIATLKALEARDG